MRAAALPTAPQQIDVSHRFRCMATDVNVRVIGCDDDPAPLVERAEAVFRRVEAACTRFDDQSPLMRANAAGEQWHVVPAECFQALQEAAAAHRRTNGRFDPRILNDLKALGYDRSLAFRSEREVTGHPGVDGARFLTLRFRPRWQPGFDESRSAVRIGRLPVDLGGIGKGLAVRWAAALLQGRARSFLIEAGGDLLAHGCGPGGDGWRAAVEDPRGGPDPVAVLDVSDRACATSSIRIRSWRSGARIVHHLVDPLTGQPGGDGLLSVTVVGADPAVAEVWSKTLFLAGGEGIADAAQAAGIAALWVSTDGRVGSSSQLGSALLWQVAG